MICLHDTRGTPQVQFTNYKEDGLVSRPPSIVYVCASTHAYAWHVMPKVSTQVYIIDRKIWKLFRPRGNGEKGQNVINSSVQHPISLIFVIHISFIIPLPMMWIL